MGVIDLLKDFSVKVPLEDYDKRRALKEKTGFDVDKAIANIESEKENDTKPETKTTKTEKASSSGRRTNVNYKDSAGTTAKKTISKSK